MPMASPLVRFGGQPSPFPSRRLRNAPAASGESARGYTDVRCWFGGASVNVRTLAANWARCRRLSLCSNRAGYPFELGSSQSALGCGIELHRPADHPMFAIVLPSSSDTQIDHRTHLKPPASSSACRRAASLSGKSIPLGSGKSSFRRNAKCFILFST